MSRTTAWAQAQGTTDQKDSDKDGIGDACDPVPCGPDDDNDGIPEAITSPEPACQLLPTDNCKGTPNAPAPNTSQANCNALAEAANGAVVLGDACDPVPCASPQPLQITDDDKKPVLTVSANSTIVQVGPVIRTYSINRLDVKTTGQNPAPGHGNAVEKAIQVSETSYRYCLEGAGFACDDPALFVTAAPRGVLDVPLARRHLLPRARSLSSPLPALSPPPLAR